MPEDDKTFDTGDRAFDIAKDIHSLFLDAMEERYKDILSFLAFVLPALTAFAWLAYQYEKEGAAKIELTFFIGTIAAIGVLLWGGAYALATSYRYRYLQASVYTIEESTGAAKFIPRSFKPSPVIGWWRRASMSIAPGIVQIHVFFFIAAIAGVGIAYCVVGRESPYQIAILACTFLGSGSIILLGAFHYPTKLNALIEDLRDTYQTSPLAPIGRGLFLLTGPSGAGKSTLRDYFCQKHRVPPISAVTTRPPRPEDREVHKTISPDAFECLLASDLLCLVAENHGHRYGYLWTTLKAHPTWPILIEVDSNTASESHADVDAIVIRVVPGSVTQAKRIIETQKSDGKEDRLADLDRQTTPLFLEERKKAGDVVFVNRYDEESLNRFVRLISELAAKKMP